MNPYVISTVPAFEPSIHIGRIHNNIGEQIIWNTFSILDIGSVGKIEMIKQGKFNRVIVHFKYWYKNARATETRERLLDGKEIKIVYSDPWFWKGSAYRPSNPKPQPKPHPKSSIRVEFNKTIRQLAPALPHQIEPEYNPSSYHNDGCKPRKNQDKYKSIKYQNKNLEKRIIPPDLFKPTPQHINTVKTTPEQEPEQLHVNPKKEEHEDNYYCCEDDRVKFDPAQEVDWTIDYAENTIPPPKKTRIPLKK